MPKSSPTRGHGLLEGLLARLRHRQADALIPNCVRDGRILDIGCGSYPAFLHATRFREKHGVDRVLRESTISAGAALGICLIAHDVNHEAPLPYGTASFHAVTMLAVFEHIDSARLVPLLTDIRRVLVDDGVLVITTPAAWTPRILRALALLRMVSAEEIDEHEGAYSLADIRATLEKAGFRSERIRTGRFEFGMNQWVTART